jgi:hypothetical protein
MSTEKKELVVNGTVILTLPDESYSKKDGSTVFVRLFVLETADQYPKKIVFKVSNEKVNIPKVGTVCDIKFNTESRESNGRWFTNNTCWSIWEQKNSAPSNTPNAPMEYPQQKGEVDFTNDADDSQLPF